MTNQNNERQKEINRIIGTSVADAKSSLRFVQDAGLLKSCVLAEMAGSGRATMIKNLKSRVRQIERK